MIPASKNGRNGLKNCTPSAYIKRTRHCFSRLSLAHLSIILQSSSNNSVVDVGGSYAQDTAKQEASSVGSGSEKLIARGIGTNAPERPAPTK